MNKKQRRWGAGLARSLAAVGFALAVLCHTRTAHAQGSPYTFSVLDSWSFLTTNWDDDNGDAPMGYTNIVYGTGPDGGSLLLDSTNPAYLNYDVIQYGYTNIMFNQGTLLFWFSPDWCSTNGGVGPGQWGRFIETGSYTTNASYGWWSIYTDEGGTNLYFSGQTNNGNEATYLSFPITWASNAWHSIALTYSPSNSTLYLDGVPVTNGSGVAYYPGTNVLANGFWMGSDSNGTNQARGLIAGVETLDSPVSSNIVATLVTQPSMAYDNGTPFVLIANAQSEATYVPTFDAITGSGILTPLSTNSTSCVNGTNFDNIWITNVIAARGVSGTNFNLTFTIAGGAPGVPYDVFVNSAMGSDTNVPPWAWKGQGYQCVTYELTNLPTTACYLILGTPQDYSGYGLTDAYEWLVFGINAADQQTDSYGVPYAWYAINGQGAQSATNDPDMDGLLNYQEYYYGTHPNISEGLTIWVSSPNGITGIP